MTTKKSFWQVGAAPITFGDRSAVTKSEPANVSGGKKKAATAPNSPVNDYLPDSLLNLSLDEHVTKVLEAEAAARRVQAGGLSHNDLAATAASPSGAAGGSSSATYDANAPRAGRLHTLLGMTDPVGSSCETFSESTDPKRLVRRIHDLEGEVQLLEQDVLQIQAENEHYLQLLQLAAQAGFKAPGIPYGGALHQQQHPLSPQQSHQPHLSHQALAAERIRQNQQMAQHQQQQQQLLQQEYALKMAHLDAQASAGMGTDLMYDHGIASPMPNVAGNMFPSPAATARARLNLAASAKLRHQQNLF